MRLRGLLWAGLLGCASCSAGPAPRLEGRVELVLLHTADLHSQIFPRPIPIGAWDAQRGLGAYGSVAEVGGAARIASLFRHERARAWRVIALDSGDALSGTAVFAAFAGRAELDVLSELGVAAQVPGNHEFDLGATALVEAYRGHARFPVVAANLSALRERDSALDFVEPWTIVSADGLRIGVIGAAHPASPAALRERGNDFGATALETAEATQRAIDGLRPLVDVIVVLSHLGVSADEALIRGTSGIDVVLGGHQHFAFDEPRRVWDCGTIERGGRSFIAVDGGYRRCEPRPVVLAHSGAYAKYVGRLALELSTRREDLSSTYDPLDRFEVTASRFELLPVVASAGDDPVMTALLEPYEAELGARLDASSVGAFVPRWLERYGLTGGDSPLGNWVASALLAFGEADLAIVNTTGIRADLAAGPVTAERWFEILPFDDTVVVASVFGRDLQALFDDLAPKARERATSPVQIAGARVVFGATDCAENRSVCAKVLVTEAGQGCAEPVACAAALEPDRLYSVATTGYLASGPSGFEVLARAGARDSGESLRDAAWAFARASRLCATRPSDLAACRAGVAALYHERCEPALRSGRLAACALGEPDALAAELCSVLPCIDGARDGRVVLDFE